MKYLWMLPLAFTLGIGCFGGDKEQPKTEEKPEVTQNQGEKTAKQPPPEARKPEGFKPPVQKAFDKANAKFKTGDSIQIEWSNSWYPGKVEAVQDKGYLISYDGYSADWNEVVGEERVRPSDAVPAPSEVVTEAEEAAVEEVTDANAEAPAEAPTENVEQPTEETTSVAANIRVRDRTELKKTSVRAVKRKAVSMGYEGVRNVRYSNVKCRKKGNQTTCTAKVSATAYRPPQPAADPAEGAAPEEGAAPAEGTAPAEGAAPEEGTAPADAQNAPAGAPPGAVRQGGTPPPEDGQ